MKLSRYLLPALALILGSALIQGCKKDEETETKYMDGVLRLVVPPFVECGYTKTFLVDTLMTLSRSDGGPIGYYFYNADSGVRDTVVRADGTFKSHYYTLQTPVTPSSVTLYLYAFADASSNYSMDYTGVTFMVVRPGVDGTGSIKHFDTAGYETFTDERDGLEYYTVEAGGNTWMRQNLAWKGAGASYIECEAMSELFGRYYTWEEAQTACPDGWRLPTDAEWAALQEGGEVGQNISGLAGKLMGNITFNDIKMWSYWREVNITDALHFSVMPCGYAVTGEGEYNFAGVFGYATFWTADATPDGQAGLRYIYQDRDILYYAKVSQTEFASTVRCVKDVPQEPVLK